MNTITVGGAAMRIAVARVQSLFANDMSTSSRKVVFGRKSRASTRLSKSSVSRKLEFVKEKEEVVNVTESWSDDENKALVQFLLFYGPEDSWPSHSKNSKFWSEAAIFVQQNGGSIVMCTGM